MTSSPVPSDFTRLRRVGAAATEALRELGGEVDGWVSRPQDPAPAEVHEVARGLATALDRTWRIADARFRTDPTSASAAYDPSTASTTLRVGTAMTPAETASCSSRHPPAAPHPPRPEPTSRPSSDRGSDEREHEHSRGGAIEVRRISTSSWRCTGRADGAPPGGRDCGDRRVRRRQKPTGSAMQAAVTSSVPDASSSATRARSSSSERSAPGRS